MAKLNITGTKDEINAILHDFFPDEARFEIRIIKMIRNTGENEDISIHV